MVEVVLLLAEDCWARSGAAWKSVSQRIGLISVSISSGVYPQA